MDYFIDLNADQGVFDLRSPEPLLYRYLKRPFCEKFLAGQIRLLPLQTYKRMESENIDLVRGDAGEGRKVLEVAYYNNREHGHLYPHVRHIFGDADVVVINGTIGYTSSDMLVMCLSLEKSKALASKFETGGCVIEIRAASEIWKKISAALGEKFKWAGAHLITYADARRGAHSDPIIGFTPEWQLKERRHEDEKEVRAAWFSKIDPYPGDFEDVNIGDLSEYCRIVDV